MIQGQFLPNKLTDPAIVRAFESVDRESLLPLSQQGIAYCDHLPCLRDASYKRYELSSLGFMVLLKHAEIKPHERVLIMGDPTGYASLLVSFLAQQVITLEQNPMWYAGMSENVYRVSPHNVTLFNGSYRNGVPSQAPFDCILVCGNLVVDYSKLYTQLKPNGRLFGFDPVHVNNSIGRQYHQLCKLYSIHKRERTRTKLIHSECQAPCIGVFSSEDKNNEIFEL